MKSLKLIPFKESAPIDNISLEASFSKEVLTLIFTYPHTTPLQLGERKHELWKATCFECFIHDEEGYDEWNFSLEGDWQCYRFESYRSPTPPQEKELAQAALKKIKIESKGEQLRLEIPLNDIEKRGFFPTVVIEGKYFYAPSHPKERPDFHWAGGLLGFD